MQVLIQFFFDLIYVQNIYEINTDDGEKNKFKKHGKFQ